VEVRKSSSEIAHRDAGQAVLLVVAVMVVVASIAAATARFGVRLVAHEQAQIAADAAALAALQGGRVAAEAVATANGGALVVLHADAQTATVVIRLGDVQATARASRAP
jgi:type II secretory pathway component PulK